MAQAEGDRQRAQGFCDAARRAGEALDLSDYAVLSAPSSWRRRSRTARRRWTCWTGCCIA
ncbi:MAG: hypothetical protein ACLTYN_18135 [Dysosmobacter welbionis]